MLGVVLFRHESIIEISWRLNAGSQKVASAIFWLKEMYLLPSSAWADPVEWLFLRTCDYWGRKGILIVTELQFFAVYGDLPSIEYEQKSLRECPKEHTFKWIRLGVASLKVDYRSRLSSHRTVKMSKTRYPIEKPASPFKRTALPFIGVKKSPLI